MSNNKQQQREQREQHSAAVQQHQSPHHPYPQNNNHQMLLEQRQMASESEENMTTTGTGQPQHHHVLQQQHSTLSNASNNSTSFSAFGSISARLDDEDPIFTLDEEVHAKELAGERTRHYTADFDPTISDDDEFAADFPKEIGNNLHGGRAYSASNNTRFPPRVRHSGRSCHMPPPPSNMNNNTGINQQHHNKFGPHGHTADGGAGAAVVPASLPIQISRGFNWPPRELVGSLSEEEDSGGGGAMDRAERRRAKTTLQMMPPPPMEVVMSAEKVISQMVERQQQQQNDSEREESSGNGMFGRIQAYSRSIQPEDDPERIFGERPHRRYSIAVKHGNIDAVGSSEEGAADSCGENIPPGEPRADSASIPVSGRASGDGSSSATVVGSQTRVIVPTGLSG